ncbi:MAG: hypothetical protein A3E87_02250 [Gammaproteobacteria bacterium RIFCSPHIGHO2_12_FULL_35_23]|nr:MAG: hypothetical protein A3E87_02250 [Gammaproteobacteria bacterium RIFCSPHIGHO2_12_FULL_35_23]
MFLDKLKQADEVYLIGKDFLSSDQDIAEDIKSVCSSSKKGKIIFVNPETKNVRWITEHKAIFNATTHASYVDLPDYVSHLTKGG